jgi:hypothetical protein
MLFLSHKLKSSIFGLAILVLFGFLGLPKHASAQSVKEVFENLSGCFEVTYQFVESGGETDKTYDPIYEWVRSKEFDLEKGRVVLEHIGQYPKKNPQKGEDPFVVQYHWREEWTRKDNGKTWVQSVYGPYLSDNFRYECEGQWKFGQLHCHADEAAKPRRDRKRDDYDYLKRINNIQVNAERWIHGQRNLKFARNNSGEDLLVSTELGWNRYERIDEEICRPAQEANPQPFPREAKSRP